MVISGESVRLVSDTALVQRTLRSGQKVSFGGNVVVLGALRGVVHAGAHGDCSATVLASSLLPTQIRIASYITRPPDGQPLPEAFCPEVAFLKDGEVVIEKYVISK